MEKLLTEINEKLRKNYLNGDSYASAKVECDSGLVEVYMEHGFVEALLNGSVWEELENALPTFEEVKYSDEIESISNEDLYNLWEYGI